MKDNLTNRFWFIAETFSLGILTYHMWPDFPWTGLAVVIILSSAIRDLFLWVERQTSNKEQADEA